MNAWTLSLTAASALVLMIGAFVFQARLIGLVLYSLTLLLNLASMCTTGVLRYRWMGQFCALSLL